MNPCTNCLENNWTYKYKEGMITATCVLCGYEVEFQARNEGNKNSKKYKNLSGRGKTRFPNFKNELIAHYKQLVIR